MWAHRIVSLHLEPQKTQIQQPLSGYRVAHRCINYPKARPWALAPLDQ